MFNIGVMSSNDIRALEDLPAYEGGDKYYVPVNLAPANGVSSNNQQNGQNNE
jgi:hypothetical protein